MSCVSVLLCTLSLSLMSLVYNERGGGGGGEVGSKLYLFSEYVENAALKINILPKYDSVGIEPTEIDSILNILPENPAK